MSKSIVSYRLPHRLAWLSKLIGPRGWGLLVLVLVAAAWSGYRLYTATTQAQVVPLDTLLVGVDYVPAPFVGGSKVRTPDGIDTHLVDELSRQLGLVSQIMPATTTDGLTQLLDGKLHAILHAGQSTSLPAGVFSLTVGYPMRARAIMRTDTDIRRWADMAGRTVCLSEGGGYVGEMASRYGAIEQVYRAPADSLLALRIGECDAAVHDDIMLTELLTLPEWRKFSASLTTDDERQLQFLTTQQQPQLLAALKKVVEQWHKQNLLPRLNQSRVRDIAFEVYLDQTVTDCH